MFSTCSELAPRAPIPGGRMERIMQPWWGWNRWRSRGGIGSNGADTCAISAEEFDNLDEQGNKFPQDRPPGGNWPKPIEKKLSCCIFSLDKFDPSNGQLVLIDQTRYGCQTLSHFAFSRFSFMLVVPYYTKTMTIMIMLMITNSSDDDNGNRGYEWCWAWPSKEQWGDRGVNRWAIIIIIHNDLF